METIVNLEKFRIQKQKLWLTKNRGRLFYFLQGYLRKNTTINYQEAFSAYQSSRMSQLEASWDYVSLRDIIYDSMEGVFVDDLYAALRQEWWFRASLLSKDEVLDQCLSIYILDSLYPSKSKVR